MTNMHYLSRSFVEFGPFSTAELSSFFVRGILQDTDYVRPQTSEDWIHVNDWVASLEPAAAPAAEPGPAAAKKAPAKKAAAKTAATKAPAKKAAKKSA